MSREEVIELAVEIDRSGASWCVLAPTGRPRPIVSDGRARDLTGEDVGVGTAWLWKLVCSCKKDSLISSGDEMVMMAE